MNMFNHSPEQLEARWLGTGTLDIGEYWRQVRRYQWRILALATLVALLMTLLVMSMTPVYRATASLLIEADKTTLVSIEEVYGLDSSRKEYFQTQYEILRSRHIAERVVDKLTLQHNVAFMQNQQSSATRMVKGFTESVKASLRSALPFLPQTTPVTLTPEQVEAAEIGRAIGRVQAGLQVSPVKNTQVVDITFESHSAELAALVANTVAEVYIENYLEAKFTMTSKATTWLNDSLAGLREKLSAAEARLAEFYEREQLVNIDGVVGLAGEEVQTLNEQLLSAQNNLKQAASIVEQITLLGDDRDALARLPVVQNHPSIQTIKRAQIEAESNVSELSETYGPKHYRMIAAQAELASIRDSMDSQLATLIGGLQGDYDTTYRNARKKVLDLQQELDAAKARYRRLTTLDNTHRALQREVDINQHLYDSFFTRLKETNELGGFETANARLLDEARPPQLAAKPRKPLIVGAAFVMTLMAGVVLAVMYESLNSGIRSVEDVERRLGLRMLGVLPKQAVKRNKSLPLRHFFDPQCYVFSEALRTIRTNILMDNTEQHQDAQVVGVASSVPKEGKTTLSMNLGFALGQLGKTLLIDGDLRRPQLADAFKVAGYQPGLANVITGTHDINECIVTDEYSGIDLLVAGSLPPNPQELLASQRFASLLASLRSRYDYILIDTAPTQAVSDAMVVAKHCDTLLYVVKADSTSDKVIQAGLSRFVQMGHRVDGVILNQVDLKHASRAGDYSGFYDPYGYQSHLPQSQRG